MDEKTGVMSGVRSGVSCVGCCVSGVRCRVSGVRCQVSGVGCRMSDVRGRVWGVSHQVSLTFGDHVELYGSVSLDAVRWVSHVAVVNALVLQLDVRQCDGQVILVKVASEGHPVHEPRDGGAQLYNASLPGVAHELVGHREESRASIRPIRTNRSERTGAKAVPYPRCR